MAKNKKKILIRDLTLRDGQQSQFATRMRQDQIDRVLPFYKNANFYACEVWGGAVPDSVMRYLGENPWTRLEIISKAIGKTSKLAALSRGRNLFGYAPYPDEVIEGFTKNTIESGLHIMRIFDALNDVDNMLSTIKYVKKYKGIADCAVCYTVDPKFTSIEKVKAFMSGKKLPHNLFGIEYFVEKAKQMEDAGADMITIKDMAGLIYPRVAKELIIALKENIKIPIDLHTHDTPGYGLASILMAMLHGIDIIDTVLMPFAGGPAAPAFELIQIFANKLDIDTGVNLEAVAKITSELRTIRKELAEFDTTKLMPIEFDISKDKLSPEIDNLFNKAIEAAKEDRYEALLSCTHKIEKHFNFPAPNENVKNAEIPGGMYTNMIAQLKQMKLDHLMDRVLKAVPFIRVQAGCPPLVTPTSQIVGSQAVNFVLDENAGEKPFTKITNQFINLVKGEYGRTPFPIDPDFREKICGIRDETPYDTSNYKKDENPFFDKFKGIKLAKTEKEELLLELFPAVAKTYLTSLRTEEVNIEEMKYKDENKPIKPVKFTEDMAKILYEKDVSDFVIDDIDE